MSNKTQKEENKRRGCGCLGCLGIIILIVVLLASCFNGDKNTTKKETETTVTKQENKATTQPSSEKENKAMETKTKDEKKTYSVSDLQTAFPVNMPFNDYINKNKEMNVDHPVDISLGKGNVGKVLQATDGLVVVCVDGVKVFDVKTFATMDEVKQFEKDSIAKTKTTSATAPDTKQNNTNVHYKSCDEARKAGAAPIKAGEPGYAKHLDRDGDGIACDKK
ncbi:hypothetical protein CON65_13905 [Bacillus pseudomycoides]|uniref:Excalibur calcium-binding domain-containing protein n=1 Tax=Bacillus pseudomycoides TaxID=64104 RepID=A0AA91VBC5_9BACI|nr:MULTISPECIES: excalibur calcium-binding domain-containing protein [Bacillus]PEB52105.1 hypothetical protein COO03_13470 [Bacillus sp. AFS098217]PED82111.1 hypothetical protein CON65_13905 [Bacillus pseudomycoides]PEU10834.1 hypothetical protein CN524_15475 [Bacillus sp. AFS019443]PEU20755.1 hypothetical protein CN525_03480 [Bacillus sp. AFS014408]PFW61262.1 hypothetical protein COL20_18310 [Bacillus sp. AFS075034]